MKKYVMYGLFALAGYYVGFYEMKYKTLKCIIQSQDTISR